MRFPLQFLCEVWEAMTFRYVSDVMDGTRRLLRMLPDSVRKTEFRRKALSPGPQGLPRWEFPTTWLMDHPTGYWLAVAIPKMEEKISKSAWKAVLHQQVKPLRAAGETPAPDITAATSLQGNGKSTLYPAGMPLRPDEIKRARGHRPKSLTTGESLCWDFSTHAGCSNPEGSCARGRHEIIKTRGLHLLIRMHLARRGGRKSEKRILPADVDGHVQNLRLQLTQQDAQHIPPDHPATKTSRRAQYVRVKEKSKASGARVNLVDPLSTTPSTYPPGVEGGAKLQHIPTDVVNNFVNNMGVSTSGETVGVTTP